MKKMLIFALAAVSLFAFAAAAQAHTLWINMTDYSPAPYGKMGAFTKSYFGWGHRYPVDDFVSMDDLSSYAVIGPKGERRDLNSASGGFLAENINLKTEGTYYVFAEKKPGFYTMFEKDGQIQHKMGDMVGCSNVILSLYYREYAKALVTVGPADQEVLSKPLGHDLEIIPLQDPGQLKTGDEFRIKVLFKGKPARFCQVLATYQGFSSEDDFALATMAGGNGEASIRLIHHGPWLVKVKMETPPGDEFKDKCLKRTYSATLTFAAP